MCSSPARNPSLDSADLSRRMLLRTLAGGGMGAALASAAQIALAQQDEARLTGASAGAAKRCLFLFLEGGPSHIDTFDPKPALEKLHGKSFRRDDKFASDMASGPRHFVKSPFRFRRCGQSGLMMNEAFEHLANVADHLCVYRGLQA
ncbi:MAG: DUF1501 domain-containing protein, partial [Planctomycetales bacterium]|nr:DUF1501 domain-containing protein [Planctomycetales bacterium]